MNDAAKLMADLRDWIEIWDEVCTAADPDDYAEPPPPWNEVYESVLKPRGFDIMPSADYFDGYWTARLVYTVRDLVRASFPREPGATP